MCLSQTINFYVHIVTYHCTLVVYENFLLNKYDYDVGDDNEIEIWRLEMYSAVQQ